MRKRFPRLFWGLCVTAALGACSGHRVPPPSTEIDDTVLKDDMRILSADDFEGRKPGTQGEEKTVAFISAQFRKLGLKPVVGDSYLQTVPLVEITARADAALSVSGGSGATALRYGKDQLIFTKRAVPSVNLRQSELVFVGYGINAAEYNWNDYAGVDVHGKTVLVMIGDPGYGTKDPAVFRGSASYYGQWAYKVEEAARQGAAGVLLIHDPGPLGYNWNVVASTWSGAQLELAKADDYAARAAVEGWVAAPAARALFAQAGLDYDALTRAACRPGFKAAAMGLKVDAEINNTVRRFNSSNVIALLPGDQRKREYVLYSAHWDSLGRDASGTIYNGAVDNASGVAGLLMLAQSFSRMRPAPDRSMLFIAFTAEEPGLLGSRYYVENAIFPLGETVGAINLDRLNIGGRTRDVMILGAGNSEIEDFVRGAALLQGRVTRPEPHPEQGLFYGAAQLNFALHGVPALDARGGVDDAARGPQWGLTQMDDYMAHRYRQPADKYSEDWNIGGAVEDLELYRAVGDRLASTRRFPRWYPGSEFSSSNRREALAE